MSKRHHIAVDLDGTLAEYDGWKGDLHIGAPIQRVVERVKAALAAGHKVTVFTARMADDDPQSVERSRTRIRQWTIEHLGVALPATATKLQSFSEFWDDRAVRVHKNMGVACMPEAETVWGVETRVVLHATPGEHVQVTPPRGPGGGYKEVASFSTDVTLDDQKAGE